MPPHLDHVLHLDALVIAHQFDALHRRTARLDRAHGDSADGAALEIEADMKEHPARRLLDLARRSWPVTGETRNDTRSM